MIQAGDAVGVGVDGDLDAVVTGLFDVPPVEVEPRWIGVDFNGNPTAGGGCDDLFGIDGVALAAEEQAPGGMADDGGRRVLDGADDAGGHGVAAQVELRMDRDDHEVELRQHVVVVVQ